MCPELVEETMESRRRSRLKDRGRDPNHHNCVDRQVYRAAATGLAGFLIAAVLPFGIAVVVGLVLLVTYVVLELAYDQEERRRARLTDADRRAGRH